mgnify:CR=1 FL=1
MSKEIAKILVETGAVLFNTEEPFTYASGIRSPIYTDCRILISKPDERKIISKSLQDEILRGEYPDIICGTAAAGIPWAAWISESLNKPMIFVRKKAKEHGRKKQVEGVLDEGARVQVVEDLVSTGGSCLDAVEVVRQNGGVVSDVVAIFSYGLSDSLKNFEDAGLRLNSLTTLDEVLEYCLSKNVLDESQAGEVRKWRGSPGGWK